MSIKVDPQKVDELSAQTKRFGEFVEREERNVYQTISQLIRETQSQYPELYGRSELNEVERLLREIRKQAEGITGELRDKAKVLTEAAARYRKDEETAKGTKKQRYQPVPPSTYYSASGGLTGEGLTSYLEDALFQDPEVQKLHQLALHGTEKEKKEAKEKLDAIFKARNTIARAQVAYSVYKAFGNTYLMEQAHKEAMKQRGILKGYGISEELYGEKVNISEYFKGSPLEACSYDPSMQIVKDGKFVQVLMPEDNQYQYLLGLVMKGGAQGAWAQKQLDEIHKQLGEIGRAQVAWHEYKAKGMTKEMDGAHAYAEKVRGILKDKYGLSSAMVDGVGYKHLWTGAGPAGRSFTNVEKNNLQTITRFDFTIYQDTVKSNSKPGEAYKRNYELLNSGQLKSNLSASSRTLLVEWWSKYNSIYQEIGRELDIPPELVFAIHYRECQMYFSNGKAFEYSIQDGKNKIPKGTTFEEESIRVLKNQLKKMNFGVKLTYDSQDLAAMMVFAELYNGFGYYLKGKNSTYIFNQTTINSAGKYTSDFNYDQDAKDAQPGIAAILLGVFSEVKDHQVTSDTKDQQVSVNPKKTDLGSYKSVASVGITQWHTIPNLESMPIFSQDKYLDGTTPSWYYEKLGDSKNTNIYQAGCTLVAIAMAESWKNGQIIDPSQLNKDLRKKKVFSGASLYMESVPNIQFDRHMGNEALFKEKTTPAESVEVLFNYAKTSIDKGNPVLLNITEPKYQLKASSGHWVLAVGYDETNKDMLIVNPAGGEVVSLKNMLKNGSAKRAKYKGWTVADYNELYSER
ncbi:C39 family peptidase [Paenibacillus lentus]|uniref:C39 family peptidase n=1 Tax=Paenibacillus lentus TaxID=1338368 RepID=UPI003646EE7D